MFYLLLYCLLLNRLCIQICFYSRLQSLPCLFSGMNGYNFPDPHSLALDYRSIGFRECLAEVARYLMTVEGMDLQDPLRLRLLSHLQCFATQRMSSVKSTLQNTTWNSLNSMSSHTTMNSLNTNQYPGNGMSSMTAMLPGQHASQSDQLTMSSHDSLPGISSVSFSDSRISQSDNSLHNTMRIPPPSSMGSHGHMTSNGSQSALLNQQIHSQFPMLNMNSMMSPNSAQSYNSAAGNLNQLGSVKPYRPWGSEITY